jgi:hypothetical protein
MATAGSYAARSADRFAATDPLASEHAAQVTEIFSAGPGRERRPGLSAIRRSLQEHPALVIGLSVLGMVAFGVTGFLGFPLYPGAAQGLHLVFQEPWVLYLWFCGLMLTLQTLMFLGNSESQRRWQLSTQIVTVACILVFGALYFYDADVLPHLPVQGLGDYIEQSPWTYTLANALLLGVFAFDMLRRWYLLARGRPIPFLPEERTRRGDARQGAERGTIEAALQVIAGDLLAAALLAIGLAGAMRPEFINIFIRLAGGSPVGATILALPGTGAHDDRHTLAHIDGLLFWYLLIGGLFALALSALFEALASANIAGALLRSFITGLRRQLSLFAFARSLRNILWPACIAAATLALAFAADSIHAYLSALSAGHQLLDLDLADDALLARAVLAGIGATLAVVTAASLQMFSLRTEIRWLREVGRVATGVLVTLWLFALVLSGFNQLLIYTHKSTATPFPWLNVSMLVSFLSLVGYSVLQRLRHPGATLGAMERIPAVMAPQQRLPTT